MRRLSEPGWWVLLIAFSVCLSVVPAVGATGSQDADGGACAPPIDQPADGVTVLAVQGAKFGEGGGKKPARLVGIGPNGAVQWVYQSHEKQDVVWQYDIDPMPNGNVFVTAAVQGEQTRVFELNPETQEVVWEETFDFLDTHDADLIDNGSKIVLANMRNHDPANGTNNDRVVVYDRQKGEIVWEWYFKNHYDRGVGGNYSKDWTHVNDVDAVGDDQFIISPRNFDQVLVINRTTKEIDMALGADDEFSVLRKQHNPDYLTGEDGTPTILVADSDNDRIVEYAKQGEGWKRTWTLGTRNTLQWPRDADRLANGNTLVTDSVHNRVLEVTPNGTVVWEAYSPWLVYDAARLSQTNESGGPTIAELGMSGTYELKGDSDMYRNETAMERCAEVLRNFENSAGKTTPTTDRAANQGETGTTEADGGTMGGGTTDDGATTGSEGQPGFTLAAALLALAGAALLAHRR